MLMQPKIYKAMIKVFFPRDRTFLSTYKVFNEVKISHYHKTIFEGEKKHGRYIFIQEMSKGKLKLEYVRFMN